MMTEMDIFGGGGGVDIDFTKIVTHTSSHSGSSFTISDVPSKPILVIYDYTYSGQTYSYVCDFEKLLTMSTLAVSSSTYVQGYNASTQELTLRTATSESITYRIAVFY